MTFSDGCKYVGHWTEGRRDGGGVYFQGSIPVYFVEEEIIQTVSHQTCGQCVSGLKDVRKEPRFSRFQHFIDRSGLCNFINCCMGRRIADRDSHIALVLIDSEI